MAVTNTEVSNLALDYLGKQNITSMNETSDEAIRCLRQLPQARRLVLAQTPWTFARRVEALAVQTINPFKDQWQFCYDIPRESVKIFRLIPAQVPPNMVGQPVPMYQEGGKIFSNEPDARLLYVFDNVNPDEWSDPFTDAVALQLALRLSPGMVRRSRDIELLRELYTTAVEDAIQLDSGQEVTYYRWGDGYADARIGENYRPDPLPWDGSKYWG